MHRKTLLLLVFLTAARCHEDHDKSEPSTESRDNQTLSQQRIEQEFFVRKIFDKYGYNGRITFEGFEHLLESLGLAKLQISDHDIHDHISPDHQFKKLHHDHIHFGSPRKKKNRRKNRRKNRSRKIADDISRPKRNHGNKLLESLLNDEHLVKSTEGRVKSYEFPDQRIHSDRSEHENALRRFDDHQGDAAGYQDNEDSNQGDDADHIGSRRSKRATGAESACMTSWEMLNVYSVRQENGLTAETFLKICPAMVYQLDIHACTERYRRQDCFHRRRYKHRHNYHDTVTAATPTGNHVDSNHGNDGNHGNQGDGHNHGVMSSHMANWNIHEIPAKVWGFATLAVTIISLVGLLGVAIVPIMQKVFYNHLIQFLVALAVGSLTGDALLHLLPHAIQASDGEGSHDKSGVYKGLVALGGIYFFFVAERLMAIITEKRRKKKAKSRRRRSLREAVVGQKLSEYAGARSHSCEDIVMVLGPNKAEVETQVMELKEHAAAHSHDNDLDPDHTEVKVKDGKGHGKGHGHSHGDGTAPTSIAAVAWMVILGDGLHNFSDGLAIGAAFANSLTGGLSTSVAVFCHELPHELGDFAVLLKAGMSVKQALFYNMVSSILCFTGMLIGVALGNISSASLWIFAVAGGMFIYIALVDMLPEISLVETRPGENVCCHLLLHLLGISVGLGIMLLIALFEDQITFSVSGEP